MITKQIMMTLLIYGNNNNSYGKAVSKLNKKRERKIQKYVHELSGKMLFV